MPRATTIVGVQTTDTGHVEINVAHIVSIESVKPGIARVRLAHLPKPDNFYDVQITERRPVLDDKGEPVIDDDGQPVTAPIPAVNPAQQLTLQIHTATDRREQAVEAAVVEVHKHYMQAASRGIVAPGFMGPVPGQS